MDQEKIRELTDSSGLLHDPEALHLRFRADGYIFLRDVLDTELIDSVRAGYCVRLAEEGLITPGDLSARWTGAEKSREEPCDDALGKALWREMIAQDALLSICRAVLGEDIHWVPIVRHRCWLPTGPAKPGEDVVSSRHQDGYFNEGIDFATCWIPVMDIPRQRGGLAIATGFHAQAYLHDNEAPFKIPDGAIPEESWRTADYRSGDVLVFDKAVPHVGLRNRTDEIRLSMDLLVSPQSAPRPIVGEVIRARGGDICVRSDEGEEHNVKVDGDTFIRDMNPVMRYPLEELDNIAPVGARVLTATDGAGRATLVRMIL